MEQPIQHNVPLVIPEDKLKDFPVKELPVVELGIHSYEKRRPMTLDEDYTIILREEKTEPIEIEKLFEDVIADAFDQAARVISFFPKDDYHGALKSLHTSITPYIPPGQTENHVDNYIHEKLKQGVPDAHGVLHVLNAIDDGSPIAGKDLHQRDYLTNKYSAFLGKYAAMPKKKITTLTDFSFTPGEARNIPEGLSPRGIAFAHSRVPGHRFQLIPRKNIFRYIGIKHSDANYKELAEDTHEELHEHLSAVTFNKKDPNIIRYTEDSSPYNKLLHLVHTSQPTGATVFGRDVNELEDISNAITSQFDNETQFATHTKSFPVFSGMYSRVDPEGSSTVKDEHGNLLYHNPGFTSTSISHNIADGFAKNKSNPEYKHTIRDIMKIQIPGGYPHGRYLGLNSAHSDEYEYLIDKGQTFRLHPQPKIYPLGATLVREWKAELVDRKDTDEEFSWQDKSARNKIQLLISKNAKPEHLIAGANDPSTSVRAAAAKHPDLPDAEHRKLASDSAASVRQAAMLRPNLSHEIIDEKLKQEDLPALKHIAAHASNLSTMHRKALANHQYPSVAAQFATRSDLTDSEQEDLVNSDPTDPKVHTELAKNRNVHQFVLHKLSQYPFSQSIREHVAKNPTTHRDILDRMIGDTVNNNSSIRTYAENNPQYLRSGEDF